MTFPLFIRALFDPVVAWRGKSYRIQWGGTVIEEGQKSSQTKPTPAPVQLSFTVPDKGIEVSVSKVSEQPLSEDPAKQRQSSSMQPSPTGDILAHDTTSMSAPSSPVAMLQAQPVLSKTNSSSENSSCTNPSSILPLSNVYVV